MFKARSARRGREAVILLHALLLAAMIAGSSSALAQGGSIQETFSTYRSAPAHPLSGWQAHKSLIAPQPAPDCELAGPEPDTVDADLWARLKLKYERYCYKQAEILIHRRLQQLAAVEPLHRRLQRLAAVEPLRTVDANNNNRRRRNLRTLKLLATIVDTATASSSVAVEEDAGLAPSIAAPTVTGSVAETISFDGLASKPLKDAKFYFERGIVSYRDGDLPVAIADFDLAIEVDPNLRDAYIDQGIAWYRIGNFNRALDVIAQAVRIKNSH
jgi:tetratricopeptide (TPR) repeat protein